MNSQPTKKHSKNHTIKHSWFVLGRHDFDKEPKIKFQKLSKQNNEKECKKREWDWDGQEWGKGRGNTTRKDSNNYYGSDTLCEGASDARKLTFIFYIFQSFTSSSSSSSSTHFCLFVLVHFYFFSIFFYFSLFKHPFLSTLHYLILATNLWKWQSHNNSGVSELSIGAIHFDETQPPVNATEKKLFLSLSPNHATLSFLSERKRSKKENGKNSRKEFLDWQCSRDCHCQMFFASLKHSSTSSSSSSSSAFLPTFFNSFFSCLFHSSLLLVQAGHEWIALLEQWVFFQLTEKETVKER